MVRCITLSLFVLASTVASLQGEEFLMNAGAFDRNHCPVQFPLPKELSEATAIELTDLESGKAIPAQVIDHGDFTFVINALAAGQTRRYGVRAIPKSEFPDQVVVQEVSGDLTVTVAGKPALTYHVQPAEPPSGVDPVYRRSGHVHPVLTPKGRQVTEHMATRHTHQHAVFHAWVNTTYDGQHLDFWNQQKGEGTVEHRELLGMQSGPVCGEFWAKLMAVQVNAPGGPRDILDEHWQVKTWDTGAGHLFEISLKQTNVAPKPLTLNEYHYGGMAIRGNEGWSGGKPGFGYLTSDGKSAQDGNHTRPHWANMHGLVDGEAAGLTVFSHPSNFRTPQPVRLHPVLPYFVFTPPFAGAIEIPPGGTYSARYLFLADDGAPDPQRLEQVWQDYVSPPTIEWVASKN